VHKVIIAAKSDNDVLGFQGQLPWHMPGDLAFFMQQIQEGTLLSGRTSFESAQGLDIFTKRENVIVLTRRTDYQPSQAQVVHTVEAAISLAEQLKTQRLCILGGADVYAQTIDLADELIISEIHGQFEGDAFFPVIDTQIWQEQHREDHPADGENPYAYSFVWYRRRV
jgi:dihydrofolate reductase